MSHDTVSWFKQGDHRGLLFKAWWDLCAAELAGWSCQCSCLMSMRPEYRLYKPGKAVTELGRRNVWGITSGEKGKMYCSYVCLHLGFLFRQIMLKRITERELSPEQCSIAATIDGSTQNCTLEVQVLYCKHPPS